MRMSKIKQHLKAMVALSLDLFQPESLISPPPATIYAEISRQGNRQPAPEMIAKVATETELIRELPSVEGLYDMFRRLNWLCFNGRLSPVRIIYSTRMRSAGSYTPSEHVIKIGRKYHLLFPEDLEDTLKHEMIHILHPGHDAAFRKEAKRIGASLCARFHPDLQNPARYIYVCDSCGGEYPRQKILRMASCGDCSHKRKFDSRYKLRLKWSRAAARKTTTIRLDPAAQQSE